VEADEWEGGGRTMKVSRRSSTNLVPLACTDGLTSITAIALVRLPARKRLVSRVQVTRAKSLESKESRAQV